MDVANSSAVMPGFHFKSKTPRSPMGLIPIFLFASMQPVQPEEKIIIPASPLISELGAECTLFPEASGGRDEK